MINDRYIAFFDLDGTILNTNSGKILVRYAYKTGLMSKREILYALYLSFLNRFNLMNPARIIKRMAKWVAGLPEKHLTEISTSVFNDELRFAIHKGIQSEIALHKSKNAKVVMLSSAVHSICSPVAEHLGMDDIISSKLEIKDGKYTGDPKGTFCFGIEKLYRLREYCSDLQCRPEDSYYYGDSISDLYVLEGVGYPVCINPDKKLRRVAVAKNWDIRDWC